MPTDANPNHASLCVEVHQLRAALEGFRALMDERDRRYDERDKRVDQGFRESKEAVSSALAAAKEQTSATFGASEKAITKAEDAQRAYNVGHNDLLRKQDLLVPRLEWEGHNRAVDEKFIDLRQVMDTQFRTLEAQIAVLAKGLTLIEGRSGGVQFTGGVLVSIVTLVIAAGAVVVAVLK